MDKKWHALLEHSHHLSEVVRGDTAHLHQAGVHALGVHHQAGEHAQHPESTDGRVDAFVAGVGTGGTITGVGSVLKKELDAVRVIAVEPSRSAVLSGGAPAVHGIQGIGAGFVPTVLDRSVIDAIITIDDDVAFACTRRLAREEGLLLGPSSGANVAASVRVAADFGPEATVVTILCDTGFRYFSVDGYIDDVPGAEGPT